MLHRMAYRLAMKSFLRTHNVDRRMAALAKDGFIAEEQKKFRQKADDYLSKYPDVLHQLVLVDKDAAIAHKDWQKGLELATRPVSRLNHSWLNYRLTLVSSITPASAVNC